MSKSAKGLMIPAAVGVGGIVLIAWLQSRPNCDKGCRTQLEHLKEHLVVDLINLVLAQFGL
jgi:hypothetical protein